ncbi:MAG: ArsR family transcriptional regulator [Candidatus Lokiarchaeota archaeon]|nr:ArsR family transcriptional regulator [Candidatus Lokiarchaeota archaeon]
MPSKKNDRIELNWKPEKIEELMTIKSPDEAIILLHEDKKQIIELLISNNAMTIQQLSKATHKNPGTIKRHLNDLIEHRYVYKSGQKQSEYNVKMKFYSCVAKEFKIDIRIPKEKKMN